MTGGRPHATSRETIAEAACELFLEQGFADTTVAEITRRAGVSRSSFFNYFDGKSDVFWAALDERITRAQELLATDVMRDPQAVISDALRGIGRDFSPESLALAFANQDPMGLGDALEREAAVRRGRIARAVSDALVRSGRPRLDADVAGSAFGGAVLSAVAAWTAAGAGRASLSDPLAHAVEVAAHTLDAP